MSYGELLISACHAFSGSQVGTCIQLFARYNEDVKRRATLPCLTLLLSHIRTTFLPAPE